MTGSPQPSQLQPDRPAVLSPTRADSITSRSSSRSKNNTNTISGRSKNNTINTISGRSKNNINTNGHSDIIIAPTPTRLVSSPPEDGLVANLPESAGTPAADAAGAEPAFGEFAPMQRVMTHRSSPTESTSRGSGTNDAKEWFRQSNQNPGAAVEPLSMEVDAPFFQKEIDSSDADSPDALALERQAAFVTDTPRGAFLPPGLLRKNPRSSSADDYRSVIDDLTIENKRLKEELKRFKQFSGRDVLDKEKKLFEIKVHGLPRRKKQELEATLRDFAASLGSVSSESASQRHRDKSASSSKHGTHGGHPSGHVSHRHKLAHQQDSPGGSRSKHASISSSRSRPVDSAYASMSTGANSSGTSMNRPSFGGPRARSSEQKVESYLQDIPEGLYPNYGLAALSDKEKKKLIVRRLEQLFTGKIGGRYTRRNRAMPPPPSALDGTDAVSAMGEGKPAAGATAATGAAGLGGSRTSSGGLVSGPVSGPVSAPVSGPSSSAVVLPPPPTPPLATPPSFAAAEAACKVKSPLFFTSTVPGQEPAREARIQALPVSHKNGGRSRDNMSTSNSNSNGDDTGTGTGTGAGSGHGHSSGKGTGNGHGKGNGQGKAPAVLLPEQRPTRPLDLDPDRVQVPAENMNYIRHLGLTPPEIGPQTETKAVDVSPDAQGWVYLNLLANLAQLHIFNVAPDFIRQAVVEKSSKFQLSPDGQKVRWRGGTDGTKFSSDGSSNDNSPGDPSVDDGDGSSENGGRKRAKKSTEDSSASALSSGKKTSKFGPHVSGSSASFHYKPLFVHRASPRASGDETTSLESDPADESGSGGLHHSKGGSNSKSIHLRYAMSHSGSPPLPRKKRRSDGFLVFYSGAPFCADLAGDSSGGASPLTSMTSAEALPDDSNIGDDIDNVTNEDADGDAAVAVNQLPGRPSLFRSMSGSFFPFRPLSDYATLSKEEWSTALMGRMPPPVFSSAATTDSIADDGSHLESPDSPSSLFESAPIGPGEDLVILRTETDGDADETARQNMTIPLDPEQPYLEASGIHRVFPEDHFAVVVTTIRPFSRMGDENGDDISGITSEGGRAGASADTGDENIRESLSPPAKEAFSMTFLMKRLEALRKQSVPGSGAGAQRREDRAAPRVVPKYVSTKVKPLDPTPLPPPAMYYPSSSPSWESDYDSYSVDSEGEEDEDESMLASSSEEMISRRANPHHSDNHASPASPGMLSSTDNGPNDGEMMEMESNGVD